ncbi:MAG: protein kinase [Deltaproteobacteria bacterium]|nr:protein kinase [Deltaproteobacteria bacterium]
MDVPQTIGGRYRVLGELARGGMGVLYRAEHTGTGKVHAVKVLLGHLSFRPDALERFRREARAAARIDSPHVVQVTDADVAAELGGAPFLVMELLDGLDLGQHLAQRGNLAPVEVVGILEQAAHAIERAHEVGIVHRDLKPNNLFLHRQPDGSTMVKVLDYGIAKSVAGASDEVSVTSSGAVLGTPTYMAPEQARAGRIPIGPPADVWALGIIAYELLVGRSYWPHLTTGEIIAELIEARIPAPSTRASGLPVGFDGWFARSCAPAPAARFPTVREQIAELARVLGVAQPAGAAVVVGPPVATPTTAPGFVSPQAGPVLSPEAYTPTVAAQLTAGGTPGPSAAVAPSTTSAVVHVPQTAQPVVVATQPSRWPLVAALSAVAVVAVGGTLLVTQRGDSDDRQERKRGRLERSDEEIFEDGDIVAAGDEDDDEIDWADQEMPINQKPVMPSGPGPHVVTGFVMTTGVPQNEVIATVESAKGKIGECYVRLLERQPDAEGRVALILPLSDEGKVVAAVTTAGGGMADPGLKSCIGGVFQGLTFPKPVGIPGSIQYTLWLAP